MAIKSFIFIKKFFTADAPSKIKRRVKVWLISRSIVRANPLFRLFSYQLRFRKISFGKEHNIIVIGAGGGIGEALVRGFLEKGCNVIGTFKNLIPNIADEKKSRFFKMDITDSNQICEVYENIHKLVSEVNLIIVATGFSSGFDYHASLDTHSLSKENLALEGKDILDSFSGNALGPYLVVRKFAGLLSKNPSCGGVSQICFLSSSLGTMNNELYGGLYGYRTGKGALHALAMAIYCDLNLEGRVGLQILGPGSVATRMNVSGSLSPKSSAYEIIKNLEYSSHRPSFQFLGVGGKRISW
jgi:NAD(P)-dependent dehydrogenase (short-subunit alcohol dehydrogenase family)